jgi:hypothetical protein
MLVYYTQRYSQSWLGFSWIMKITINVEIDTENPHDVSTIEELIETLKELQRQCSD